MYLLVDHGAGMPSYAPKRSDETKGANERRILKLVASKGGVEKRAVNGPETASPRPPPEMRPKQ